MAQADAFGFRALPKAKFYANYFFSKAVRLPFEVRSPRWRLYRYEFFYTVDKLLPFLHVDPYRIGLDHIETRFGRFLIRPHTIDAACVSPAFERPDVDRLLAHLGALLTAGNTVLFVDIGADIGTYTVLVLNQFADANLTAMVFEPSQKSHALLSQNLVLNGVDHRATVINAALGDEGGTSTFFYDARAPGSSGIEREVVSGSDAEIVTVTTLDDVLSTADKSYDVLFIKMDVEGAEKQVLAGASGTIGRSNIVLLVEDFIERDIVRELISMNFRFDAKLTPYNSWWSSRRRVG